MADERGWWARHRSTCIILALVLTGLIGVVAKVRHDPSYGWVDAGVDLAIECLPAAVLFLIINQAIDGYEARQEHRAAALQMLRDDGTGSTGNLLASLERRGVVRLGILQSVNLADARVVKLRLADGSLKRSDLDRIQLTHCSLQNVSIPEAFLRGATFEHCQFRNVDFRESRLNGAFFSHCTFDHDSSFVDASITDARFTNSTVPSSVLRTMNPAGCHLRDCKGISTEDEEWLRTRGAVVTRSNGGQSGI